MNSADKCGPRFFVPAWRPARERDAPVCICCGEDVDARQNFRPPLPFCKRCLAGGCRGCWSWVRVRKAGQDPTFNLIGRPRGPRMKCGWGCGAELTSHQMRAHFTTCPNRPPASQQITRRGGILRVKRGRPPGRRMLCGWGCCAKLTASRMRRHFAACSRRPRN
jgi:hypothetical protein